MKNSAKLQNKIAKQNLTVKDSFDYPSQPMKSKSDRGYRDYFGNAVSEFERTLRSNKAEVARRVEESRILSYEEQVERSKKLQAIENEKRAIAKAKNSEAAKLAERNNFLGFTKEGAEYQLLQKGFKHVTDEKGNVKLVSVK